MIILFSRAKELPTVLTALRAPVQSALQLM